jgi:hypothetical protein
LTLKQCSKFCPAGGGNEFRPGNWPLASFCLHFALRGRHQKQAHHSVETLTVSHQQLGRNVWNASDRPYEFAGDETDYETTVEAPEEWVSVAWSSIHSGIDEDDL